MKSLLDSESNKEKFFLIPIERNVALMDDVVNINETGLFLLKILQKPANFDLLVKKLISEYEVDYKIARADVQNFINMCLEKKIIKKIDEDIFLMVENE